MKEYYINLGTTIYFPIHYSLINLSLKSVRSRVKIQGITSETFETKRG
jgi:hypothetical protein